MKFIIALTVSVIGVSLGKYIGLEYTLDTLMMVALTTLMLISDR